MATVQARSAEDVDALDAPASQAGGRWQGRAASAVVLRAGVFILPVVASSFTSWALASRISRPSGWAGATAWWIGILSVSTVVLVVVERLTRRALPMAALLKMSMVFPDQAPSRLAVARRAGSVRNLEARLEQARTRGVAGEPVKAAEEILGLVALLNAHDRRTRGHSERVRALAEMIAEEMNLPVADREKLRWSALLHDVGKIHVHRETLNKEGALSDDEWSALKAHPLEGAKLVAPLVPWLGEWSAAIQQHHESFDGRGYPYGLKGTSISLGARIVAVADAFDAMVAARSYRDAISPAAARRELIVCSGSQFDPEVVRAFVGISIGRVRWAMGPVAWMAQVPLLGWLGGISSQVAVTSGSVAAAGSLAVAAVVNPAMMTIPEPDDPPAVVTDGGDATSPTSTSTTIGGSGSDGDGLFDGPSAPSPASGAAGAPVTTSTTAATSPVRRGQGGGPATTSAPTSTSTTTTTSTTEPKKGNGGNGNGSKGKAK